jgi:small subunit ribosomal protein S8
MGQSTDPIADMLTKIRNSCKAKHPQVDLPSSIIKTDIARLLKDEGFIRHYKVIDDEKQGTLRIFLRYGEDDESLITKIKRVSKPGRRAYTKIASLSPIMRGNGLAILSTSAGIMSDKECRKKNIGGEVICYVW